MADAFYVSEPAYIGLISLAVKGGFLRENAKITLGISDFLVRLSFSAFLDSRSPKIRQKHEKTLKNGRMPKWHIEGELRVPRLLTLTDEAIINYIEAAINHGIRPEQPPVMGIRNFKSPTSIVSMVLEAIGNGYLQPVQLPAADIDTETGRRKKMPTTPRKSRVASIAEENPYFVFVRRNKKGM